MFGIIRSIFHIAKQMTPGDLSKSRGNKKPILVYTIFLDPCSNTFEHALLKDDGFRSPACRRSQSDPLCDDTLVEDWYLLQPSDGSSYLRIHRECPTIGTCGTDKPIWMNGTLQYIAVKHRFHHRSTKFAGNHFHCYCRTN